MNLKQVCKIKNTKIRYTASILAPPHRPAPALQDLDSSHSHNHSLQLLPVQVVFWSRDIRGGHEVLLTSATLLTLAISIVSAKVSQSGRLRGGGHVLRRVVA